MRGTVAGVAGLPALVLGKGIAEMRSDVELAFVAGRTLAAMRPDHLLRWPSFVPTLAELEIVVLAAIRLVNRESEVPPEHAAAVAQYTTFLERTLSPQLRRAADVLVRRFQAAGNGPDVGRWSRAACLPRSAPDSCWLAISRWRRGSDRPPTRRSTRARSCAICAPGVSPNRLLRAPRPDGAAHREPRLSRLATASQITIRPYSRRFFSPFQPCKRSCKSPRKMRGSAQVTYISAARNLTFTAH